MAITEDLSACDTEHQVGQDNIQVWGLDVHNPVFVIAAVTIILFVVFALLFQDSATNLFSAVRMWTLTSLDWLFMMAANFFVLYCLFLIVSPLGKIRIGGADAKTDYSYPSWFAMMFAAGVGIPESCRINC